MSVHREDYIVVGIDVYITKEEQYDLIDNLEKEDIGDLEVITGYSDRVIIGKVIQKTDGYSDITLERFNVQKLASEIIKVSEGIDKYYSKIEGLLIDKDIDIELLVFTNNR